MSPEWAVVKNGIWLRMQNRDCLGVLLIKRAPSELEMIKKGSSAWGSGVSVCSGSGSQPRWHRVILTDRVWAGVEFADNRGRCGDTVSTFHLRSLVKHPQVRGEHAAFCAVVLSSPSPRHAAAAPVNLCRCWWRAEKSMQGTWPGTIWGSSCMNYSFARRDSGKCRCWGVLQTRNTKALPYHNLNLRDLIQFPVFSSPSLPLWQLKRNVASDNVVTV